MVIFEGFIVSIFASDLKRSQKKNTTKMSQDERFWLKLNS